MLKPCSVPRLRSTEPNYPQSYPQFWWKIAPVTFCLERHGGILSRFWDSRWRLLPLMRCPSRLSRERGIANTSALGLQPEILNDVAEPADYQEVRRSRLPHPPTQHRRCRHTVLDSNRPRHDILSFCFFPAILTLPSEPFDEKKLLQADEEESSSPA